MKLENQTYLKTLLTVPERRRSTQMREAIYELLADYREYLETCLAIETQEE